MSSELLAGLVFISKNAEQKRKRKEKQKMMHMIKFRSTSSASTHDDGGSEI